MQITESPTCPCARWWFGVQTLREEDSGLLGSSMAGRQGGSRPRGQASEASACPVLAARRRTPCRGAHVLGQRQACPSASWSLPPPTHTLSRGPGGHVSHSPQGEQSLNREVTGMSSLGVGIVLCAEPSAGNCRGSIVSRKVRHCPSGIHLVTQTVHMCERW